MTLGGYGRDFKKKLTQSKALAIKVKSELDTKEVLINLQEQVNKLNAKVIDLGIKIEAPIEEIEKNVSYVEESQELQRHSIESLKNGVKSIDRQFKKVETILIQHKSNIQLLTNELEKKNPWIPVLIGCAIGLSGVLGYVVSLI